MLTLEHLFNPLRTAEVVRRRVRAQLQMRRFAARSKRHFLGDPRYDLNRVTEGFAPRCGSSSDDRALLERICRAYSRTISHPDASHECYQPTEWWRRMRAKSRSTVTRALEERDIATLQRAYGNFFRDRCSTGLVGVPYGGMEKAYFRGPMREVHRHCYLGDVLYRLDYWRSITGGRFDIGELAGPEVGNPFGVCIDGTFVQYCAEFQHYCAHRVLDRVDSRPAVVGEIGGGYGGAAYYLVRDGGRIKYVGFDVSESVALASYYLLKSFPKSRFLLFGEQDLTAEALASADIVLLPLFTMPAWPAKTVDLMFSSYVMGDLSDSALEEYLKIVGRITKDTFVHYGDSGAGERIARCGSRQLTPVESRITTWNNHKAPEVEEGEYFYRIAP